MEEEIIIKKRYSIPYEMFGDAFTTFQKRFVYPRNFVMAAILVAAAVLNIINIVRGNSSKIGYVLVCACLGLACVNFINPRKLKSSLMESIKGIEDDVFEMTLSADKVVIGTVLEPVSEEEKPKEEYEEVFDDIAEENAPNEEIAETEIYLNSGVVVTDKPEYFMIYIKKAMFYVVPKKDFSEEEITVMQLHFEKMLGKNYRKYEK